jgi:cytidine deaminase
MMSEQISAESRLMAAAMSIRMNAYSPYSGVTVGAAILSLDGQVFLGANIENQSYGLAICAERVAVANAVLASSKEWSMLAIAMSGAQAAPPCGACLQTLAEFASPDLVIIWGDNEENWNVARFGDLLPNPFKRK